MGKIEKFFYWFCLVLAIYTVLGFKLLPTVIKDQLISNLDETLTQQTTVRKVDFNYYYYSNYRWNYDNEKWGEVKYRFNGSDKLKDRFTLLSDYNKNNDVIIETNMSELVKNFQIPTTNQFIKQSNEILSNLLGEGRDPKGKYNIGCFDIEVNQLVDENQKHIEGSQYVFDTSEYLFK